MAMLWFVIPNAALAHSFGKVYSLPIPLHLYVAAVGFALLLSTVAAVWMLKARGRNPINAKSKAWAMGLKTQFDNHVASQSPWAGVMVGLLLLCMAASAFGVRNPFANISMNLFWIDFMLVFFYLNFFFDDFSRINPWRWIAQKIVKNYSGTFNYSATFAGPPSTSALWGSVPFFTMLALFAVELLTHANPRALAVFLVVYLLLTLWGSMRFGVMTWFRHYDFFQVFFHLFSIRRIREQKRLSGLELYMVFFVLAMTTFDGLKETLLWVSVYWGSFYQHLLNGFFGLQYGQDFKLLQNVFTVFETLTLVVAPVAYMLLFALFAICSAHLLNARSRFLDLFFSAGMSVIPIVVTYHAAHYLSLMGEQAFQFPFMLFDPFGWGWLPNVSAMRLNLSWTLPPEWAWHIQVVLILAGHAWGGVLLHQVIAEFSATRVRAFLAHACSLTLMVCLTTVGLWVLSLPINPNA